MEVTESKNYWKHKAFLEISIGQYQKSCIFIKNLALFNERFVAQSKRYYNSLIFSSVSPWEKLMRRNLVDTNFLILNNVVLKYTWHKCVEHFIKNFFIFRLLFRFSRIRSALLIVTGRIGLFSVKHYEYIRCDEFCSVLFYLYTDKKKWSIAANLLASSKALVRFVKELFKQHRLHQKFSLLKRSSCSLPYRVSCAAYRRQKYEGSCQPFYGVSHSLTRRSFWTFLKLLTAVQS